MLLVARRLNWQMQKVLSKLMLPEKHRAGRPSTDIIPGETLRGLLLNTYAFDTMALVAKYASIGALSASAILFALALLGFRHAGAAAKTQTKKR
jgi:hypothetical protein